MVEKLDYAGDDDKKRFKGTYSVVATDIDKAKGQCAYSMLQSAIRRPKRGTEIRLKQSHASCILVIASVQ